MEISYKKELYMTPERLGYAIAETEHSVLQKAEKLVFCGCGTSYYLGNQCAQICRANGRKADAVDAIELISGQHEPDLKDTYVFISRSGNSEETVRAATAVKDKRVYAFYLGCTYHSRLSNICDDERILPYGNEKLILESYSYYVQLAAALRCCGIKLDEKLPGLLAQALAEGESGFYYWLRMRKISRIISLASPFYRPLHREMMLKDGEISQLPVEEWGILEFRHGPRSWCGDTTLIHIVSSQSTRQWDINVAKELVSYGCPVIWYGEDAPEGCFSVKFDIEHQSAEEVLLFGAFHTSIAVEIGRSLGTCPENLRHIVHNVGGL